MSPRTPAHRHGRILRQLQVGGEVRTSALAREFGVTVMTVWRDLEELSEQGLIERVHGGARLRAPRGHEIEFEAKAVARVAEKRWIAAEAARRFVRSGDVVALEGGTTVAALVEYLPAERVSVVTNSLPVALRIRDSRPALPVRVIGGWLSGVSGNTVGQEALDAARSAKSTVCFLGATGWGDGPMDPNPMEIEIKRALAASCARVVLLLDSAKFSIPSASVMIHLRRVHALVTEAPPPAAVRKQLAANGVELVVAAGR